MTEYTYVCPTCGTTTEREFRVPSVVRTCEEGCGFVHFLRADLLELTERVPESDRPDDWEELHGEERLRIAMRQGYVTLEELRS
ncbi:MAG: hypothetical protein V5A61_11820 [Haloarculaceae archaeon]